MHKSKLKCNIKKIFNDNISLINALIYYYLVYLFFYSLFLKEHNIFVKKLLSLIYLGQFKTIRN